MNLTFLKAAMALSKTLAYSARDDAFSTSHYPMAKRFTSNEKAARDMFDFFEHVRDAGNAGQCLLFGGLDRPLVDESRAEHATTDRLHDWVMFDFDKVDAPPTMEGALEAIKLFLPECCQRAECVIQLSPSCYNPRATKLSAHVFMRLNTPQTARRLKEFITWINFENAALYAQQRLTESASALTFRLDRCVADASRLIYIAPPRCVGFTPTLTDTLAYFDGEPGFDLPNFTAIDKAAESVRINELRRGLGMEDRDFRTIKFQGLDVLSECEEGIISDVKPSGSGFIRFNLNGGDSHAYFIDLKKPEVIRNFKGEPYLLTKKVDPSFFSKLIAATKTMPQQIRGSESTEVLAFYATNHGSKLYIGTYDRAKDKLRVDESSETAAASWLRQFGVPAKGLIPHYDLTHDISSDVRYEEGYPVINLYERTDFMKQYGHSDRLRDSRETMLALEQKAPVITKFIRSMCGDDRSAEGFVNWLAFIFQFRVKTGTAWLLWGTEGTGKGLFMQHVMRPLFGDSNVSQMMMTNVDSSFNALLEGKVIVNIDEAEMARTRDKPEAMAKLRNWITEPTIVVNKKNISEREVQSFANFIVTANSFRPLMISSGDRRFHVGTRQDTRLLPTANEFATLAQGEEVPYFARLLGECIVDEHWVRNPELTEHKMKLFESTHSLVDNVAIALQQGDAAFFFEARPTSISLGATTSTALLPISQYDDLLRAMVDNTFNVLRAEDLWVLFTVVVNDSRMFPENQTIQKQIYDRYGLLNDKRPRHCKRRNMQSHSAKGPEWQEVPQYLIDDVLGPNMGRKHDTVVSMRG